MPSKIFLFSLVLLYWRSVLCNEDPILLSELINRDTTTESIAKAAKLSDSEINAHLNNLGCQNLTVQQYAAELKKVNTTFGKQLAEYYSKISPLQTIFKQGVVLDCIPFEQQESIIDLPADQKDVAINHAHQILFEMMEKLTLPENQELLNNILSYDNESCPYGSISQVRPTFIGLKKEPSESVQTNTQSPKDVLLHQWSDLIFPNGVVVWPVTMNTQPTPGTPSPTVFFAGDDVNAQTENDGSVTINQLWLLSTAGGESVEFGWWTWGGYPPYLFSYGTNNNWASSLPFTSAPGTPFPANQPGNYHQTLSLYYIVASKGPGDVACGGDPNGCYALEVATSFQGVRTSDFWLVGWYSKSYYNYQYFTSFEAGLEIQSQDSPVCGFGAFYNVGTNLTQANQQTFNLQDFGQAAGISSTWTSGPLCGGTMTFSGCTSP